MDFDFVSPDMSKAKQSIFDGRIHRQGIVFFEDDEWSIYASSYKAAADQLIDKAIQDQGILAYSTMFLYRHYLELRLKELLITLQLCCDVPREVPHKHDLRLLWGKVRPLLEHDSLDFLDEEDRATADDVEDRIHEFDRIDKGSYSFRYPVDRNNVPSLNGKPMINLLQVREVINVVSSFLEGVSSMCAETSYHIAEMREEYEAEMRQEYEAEMWD